MRVVSIEKIPARRKEQLQAALETQFAFRTWMVEEASFRREEELLYMLLEEIHREVPRRNMVARIHSAYSNLRRQNEWIEILEQHGSRW